MFLKFKKNNKSHKDGFTILVAVVTASILLIIAMSIGGIALKEQVLSASGKESQVAFFAADTAMECALYWDQKVGVFAPDQNGNPPSTPPSVGCNNNSLVPATASSFSVGDTQYSYSFVEENIPVGNGSRTTCAQVTVTKYVNDSSFDGNGVARDPTRVYTTIAAYGYNTCNASLNRLERGIIANY